MLCSTVTGLLTATLTASALLLLPVCSAEDSPEVQPGNDAATASSDGGKHIDDEPGDASRAAGGNGGDTRSTARDGIVDGSDVPSSRVDGTTPSLTGGSGGRDAGGPSEAGARLSDGQSGPVDVAHYGQNDRPQFHYSPPNGLLKDPNGLVYFEGEWHLYFQHIPADAPQDSHSMAWGHAVSADLLHWTTLPVAIPAYGDTGIYSGTGVVDLHDTTGLFGGGSGICVFHGTDTQKSIFAEYSVDRGRTFQSLPGFSLDDPQDSHDAPKVFWHEPTSRWIMLTAALKSQPVFTSPDLRSWTYQSTISREGECPDLFPLPVGGNANNVKWVFSVGRSYTVGAFDGSAYSEQVAEGNAMLGFDLSEDAYIYQTWENAPSGRRIVVAWMVGLNDYDRKNSWNGWMTFPRELSLVSTPGGLRVAQNPIAEIDSLRFDHRGFAQQALREGDNPLATVHDRTYELIADIDPGSASEVRLDLRGTIVSYDVHASKLTVSGNLSGGNNTSERSRPSSLVGGRLKLHVLVDRSTVEIFAADGLDVISEVAYAEPSADTMAVAVSGGTAVIGSLDYYHLASIW